MRYHRSTLTDRLLAPASHVMARLSFGRKALLIAASFMLSCGVLSGVLVTRSLDEMAEIRTQRSASTGLAHLHDAMLAMQERRQLLARGVAGDAVPDTALLALATSVERSFAASADWQASEVPSPILDAGLSDARQAWEAVDAASGEAAIAAHTAAITAVRSQMARVSGVSGAVQASDPAVLYMARAASEWLPTLTESSAQQALVGIRVLGEGAIWVDDRIGFAVSRDMQDFLRERIATELASAEERMPALKAGIGARVRAASAGVDKQNGLIQTWILDADVPSLAVPAMAQRGDATRLAMAATLRGATSALDAAAAAELARLQQRTTTMAAIVVLVLLLSAYLFLGFSRSTRASLRTLQDAAERLAAGEFPESVRVDSRDELRDIAGSLESAVRALRAFADAQRRLFESHQEGETDERLDTAVFPGSFGVMAGEINTLVGSHIALNTRVIDVVASYARGDLTVDIERLPGRQAEVTAAVDAVKAGMQAVNAEIKDLVDAAVAGDFSRRGDAQRFEHVYREMVEGLDTLMTRTDHGLGDIDALLAAVAGGDLTRKADANLPGQLGRLAASANETVAQLATVVGQIRQGSDAINAAASEIAAGNNDLSRRTEQQAASLEETASSMEELTSTVRQNADNARQANQLAIGAVDVASQGGEVVDRVVQTMSAISDSSNRIADIIGVIDGIAFQTNILALNAAVEAARAGEQGRGFAVVAAEVRSLAQRSAGAAKEIKTLITDSADKVRHGNELVGQAGRTMGEIVTSVKRVTDIIADISAASQEQSAGIEQVNHAITHMDESTQQNAALVEEATAAARSMEQQAGQLVQTVAVFRVHGGQVAQVRAEAAPGTTATATPGVVPLAKRTQAAVSRGGKPASRARATAPAAMATEAAGEWQEF
jgi:methyl-accepting chemotaxis protein